MKRLCTCIANRNGSVGSRNIQFRIRYIPGGALKSVIRNAHEYDFQYTNDFSFRSIVMSHASFYGSVSFSNLFRFTKSKLKKD